MTALILGIITIFTSSLTAVLGIGGGLLLVGIMPSFLPIQNVVPIHAFTQLASNVSRALFSWREVNWNLVPQFLIGGLAGISFFALLLNQISFEVLPLIIASYILLSQWSSKFNQVIRNFENFYITGFLHVGVGLLIGSPGALHLTLLKKRISDHNQVVATAAAMALFSHAFKLIAFLILGVNIWQHFDVTIAMIIGAIIGSYLGTKIRINMDTAKITLLLKIILTVLSLNMIVKFIL